MASITFESLRYGAESGKYFTRYPRELGEFLDNPDLASQLEPRRVLSIAGSAVMGGVITDCARNMGIEISRLTRDRARFYSGVVLHFADEVDDVIDTANLSADEKAQVIDLLLDNSGEFGPDNINQDLFARTARMSEIVREKILNRHPLLTDIFTKQYPETESHFGGFSDLDGANKYLYEIGRLVGQCSFAAAEVALDDHLPDQLKDASVGVGVSVMALDHAFEIASDISEGTMSLATAHMQYSGDEGPRAIKAAREYCIDFGRDALNANLSNLDRPERNKMLGVARLSFWRSICTKYPSDTRALRKLKSKKPLVNV